MSKLVIVESPAKAKTIKKYLGGDYEVIASMGHVRDLPKARLCVDVKNDFKPKYAILKGKEKLVSELKEAAEEADTVYLATDPDREGEAISWHLAYILGLMRITTTVSRSTRLRKPASRRAWRTRVPSTRTL